MEVEVKLQKKEEVAEVKCTKSKWLGVIGANQPRKHRHRPECAHTEPPLPQPTPNPPSLFHFSRPRSDCDLSQFPLWSGVWCTLLGDFDCRTS